MESSEESSCDDPLDPVNSSIGSKSIVFTSIEDFAQNILSSNQIKGNQPVVEALDNKNCTLVLDKNKIELFGKDLTFAQGSKDDILGFLDSEKKSSSECTLSPSASGNLDNIDMLPQPSSNLRTVSSEEKQMMKKNVIQNIAEKATLYIDPIRVDSENKNNSSKALNCNVQEKEDTTEMVFVPKTSQFYSVDKTRGFLHLFGHIQTASSVSKLHGKEEIQSVMKVSEESDISQMDLDTFPSTVDDVGVSAVTNEDDNNSLPDEHLTAEIIASSNLEEDSSSILSIPPQDIDHAVSDIHITAFTLAGDQEWGTKDIQEGEGASEIEASLTIEDNSSMLSMPQQDIGLAFSDVHLTSLNHANDQDWRTNIIQEDKNKTEETGPSNIALSAVSTNVTFVECSNLKEPLDLQLLSESSLTREASNHCDIKSSADSSNKYDNANSEISDAVEETMDVDTNESMHFPPQFPSGENIVEANSECKNTINFNNNNSYIIENFNQNLNDKIFYPSSKICQNEMDFINSEEACSENHSCIAGTSLSFDDNSKTKNSFSYGNIQSKDCNLCLLNKMKSISPCKVKVIDEYNFENSLDQELIHNSSLDIQSSDNISTEVDATKVSQLMNFDLDVVAGNLTFQGILTPIGDRTKLYENLVHSKNSETCSDNSQYLFDQVQQHNDNHSSSKILKNINKKFFEDKQNLVYSEVKHTDINRKSDENFLCPNNVMNIDNNSEEDYCMHLNIATSDEITIKQPQRTYVRRKRNSDSVRNIELFSGDFSDNESYSSSKIFCRNNEQEQVIIDEDGLIDEDGDVNLKPSYFKNGIKTPSIPEEESTISSRPEATDHLLKNPDPIVDNENFVITDGVNINKNSKENVRMCLNIAADETAVIPPQRTYIRKKKNSDSDRNVELFSDDFSYFESCSPKICIDNEQEQIMTDEYSLPDEDGYVDFMSSNPKNKTKAQSMHVDKNTISLRSESSNHIKKAPDPVVYAKDSISACGIDNKSKENNSVSINLYAFDETTIKPSPRTYIRKKRTSDSVRNIELFSDDLSDNEKYSTPDTFCINNEQEEIMIDEDSLTDEDGYINLMPSYLKSRVKAQSIPEDKRSTRLIISDFVKKPDPFAEADNSVSTFDVSIDNNSKENNSLYLNLSTSNENTVKPPQRTYIRKKKTSESLKDVELFSDDFSNNEPYSPKTCSDNIQEQIMIDEYSLPDEDGYVNLMPSYSINSPSIQVDEKTISLRPESSDHLLLINIPDPLVDVEDSTNMCGDPHFIKKSFKPTNTEKLEGNALKSTSHDVPKVESSKNSLKKRVQTPSYKKIGSKIDGPLWNKSVKGLPDKMKKASSIKRKVSMKFKRSLKNSKHSPVSKVHQKIIQPSKDVEKSEHILHSISSLPERVKDCNIRFLNDNSTEKNYCHEIDELNNPPTAAQKLKNFQYNCWHCNFVSNKVNNLIMHLKYCEFKSSADMMDKDTHDMKEDQIHREFSESSLEELETSSSDGSFTLKKPSASHPTNSEGLHVINLFHCPPGFIYYH